MVFLVLKYWIGDYFCNDIDMNFLLCSNFYNVEIFVKIFLYIFFLKVVNFIELFKFEDVLCLLKIC